MLSIQSAIKMPSPIVVTLRIPEVLKAEAEAYADGLGISLNALLAVSLREYLNGQRSSVMPPPVAPVTPDQPLALPAPAALPLESKPATEASPVPGKVLYPPDYAAPANPKWNCPCGSKKPWLKCHGRPRKA